MPGAIAVGASGELKCKEAVRQVQLARSGNTKGSVAGLIGQIIT